MSLSFDNAGAVDRGRRKIRMFFLVQGVTSLILVVVFGLMFKLDYDKRLTSLLSNEKNALAYQEREISLIFNGIVSDLLTISSHHELLDLINNRRDFTYTDLASDMLVISQRKKTYDQIRYLDSKGLEIFRINYHEGKPEMVPQNRLQNKGGRYYFTDTIKLERGDIFVSPLDLNIENGEIERPFKPMIRFGTPVFGRDGQKSGVVVINYLAVNLIKSIISLKRTESETHAMLLNQDGYWLASPQPENEWGFMFGTADVFQKRYPHEWARILKSRQGQFINQHGLFTYTTIYPLIESWKSSTGSPEANMPSDAQVSAEKYFWKSVRQVPPENLEEITYSGSLAFFLGFLFLFAVTSILSWLLSTVVAKWMNTLSELKVLLEDKEVLIKEVHHRVKNNLVVVENLLSLQANNTTDDKSKYFLTDAEGRVRSMTLIHEILHNATDVRNLGTKSYMERFIPILFQNYKMKFENVQLELDIEDINVDVDTMIPLGLIINELVSNSLKYGFPDNHQGSLNVSLKAISNSDCELVIKDTGVGLPEGFELQNASSLGLTLVNMLIKQINGDLRQFNEGGAEFRISFATHRQNSEKN